MCRGSWWRGRTSQGGGQRERWEGWSRPGGGRTPSGRAGSRWIRTPDGNREDDHDYDGDGDGDYHDKEDDNDGDLFSTVWRQVKHQNCEEGYSHAGNYQVHLNTITISSIIGISVFIISIIAIITIITMILQLAV